MKWLKKAAPMWLVMVLVIALIGMGSAWAAVGIPVTGEVIELYGETYTVDGNTEIVSKGVTPNAAAVGAANTDDEFETGPLAPVTTIVVEGNFIFTFDYKVSTDKTVAEGTVYTIKVYLDDSVTPTATFTLTGPSGDAAAGAGATCVVDVGGAIPETIEVIAQVTSP